MSDRLKTAPDVPFKPAGAGMSGTFRCTACGIFKSMYGRRTKRMPGYIRPQYVCRECLK